MPIQAAVESVEINQNSNTNKKPDVANVQVQTISHKHQIKQVSVQTVEDKSVAELKQNIQSLHNTINKKSKELAQALSLIQQRNEENLVWNTEKVNLEASFQTLKSNNNYKEKLNEKLQLDLDELRKELDYMRTLQTTESTKQKDTANNETKSLLLALKQIENDKSVVIAEYKELLNNEREEYSKTIKELNIKNMELQSKLDR